MVVVVHGALSVTGMSFGFIKFLYSPKYYESKTLTEYCWNVADYTSYYGMAFMFPYVYIPWYYHEKKVYNKN